MKMTTCSHCGESFGHHAGLPRCPKCGHSPNLFSAVASRPPSRRCAIDDEENRSYLRPIDGRPHELNFDEE